MHDGTGPHAGPLCPCHGEVMDRNKGGHECAVKRRERHRRYYHADPEAKNYARRRHALRARIRAKKARIKELEYAEEDGRRT